VARADNTQFNVRSAFVRNRVREITYKTGMTAAQVVEEALRAYVPPPSATAPAGLVRRGPLLVAPSRGDEISLDQAEDALNAVREERS
jgi:hypothetical protein